MKVEKLTYYADKDVQPFMNVVAYFFQLTARRFRVRFHRVDAPENAQLIFSNSMQGAIMLAPEIYGPFSEGRPCASEYINKGHIYPPHPGDSPDLISTVFFMVNALQESDPDIGTRDPYGRFSYENSYQSLLGYPAKDLVTPLLRQFLVTFGRIPNPVIISGRSILLSHDVDFLHAGFGQEFRHLLKKPGSPGLRAIMDHATGKKEVWNNLDAIMDIEAGYGVKSVFYFLPARGKEKGMLQADYTLKELRALAGKVVAAGWECGLHKSHVARDYALEMEMIPLTAPASNRNHYLTYSIPGDWTAMKSAGISLDTGLGWASTHGLRNSYAFPFYPFSGKDAMPLVMPLVLMDTTFDRYMPNTDIFETFVNMVEGWPDGFCVSILFHNNYLTPGSNELYLTAYKKIMSYMKAENILAVSVKDIMENNPETMPL